MKRSLLVIALLIGVAGSAQVEFSLETGLSGMRNFSPQQKFWAIGQTVQTIFHFSPQHSAYVGLDYFTEGKFKNRFTAIAKSPLVQPQQQVFTATGRLIYRHFSAGWKYHFTGSYNQEKTVNIYGMAGFGILFARLKNQFSPSVDTMTYVAPIQLGSGRIRKLTFDVGIGGEMALGGNVFGFADVRTWLPASSSTSPFLHHQKNVPLPLMVSAGVRILFSFSY